MTFSRAAEKLQKKKKKLTESERFAWELRLSFSVIFDDPRRLFLRLLSDPRVELRRELLFLFGVSRLGTTLHDLPFALEPGVAPDDKFNVACDLETSAAASPLAGVASFDN